MNVEEMLEVFGEVDPSEYQEEARDRWGHTDLYEESVRRTKSYGKDQWKEAGAEGRAIGRRFADLMGSGAEATDRTAMDLAEQHRRYISRWFYTCSYEVHAGLGDMYVADPRFTRYWEGFRPGLALFVRDAFQANAGRAKSEQ